MLLMHVASGVTASGAGGCALNEEEAAAKVVGQPEGDVGGKVVAQPNNDSRDQSILLVALCSTRQTVGQ